MQANYTTNDYSIYIVEPNGRDFYFPYVLCVPKTICESNTLYVETNNEEEPNNLNISAERTVQNILSMMSGSKNKSPILLPILPTNGIDSRPYFQQLSRDCFDNSLPIDQQRIDLQLAKVIEDAKNKFYEITGAILEDKVFMHGYSASGVFAQRFALIHPELIGELCVGGAIGSVPMPLDEYNGNRLNYPIGTNDYEELFGKPFDWESYKKIKFRYYVAELEDKRLSQTRRREDDTPAPMHDMSYMDRSMPSDVGQNLREAFGIDLCDRCANQLRVYKEMGLNVSAHQSYEGVMHNEIRNLAFKYIDDCLSECIRDRVYE